MELQQEEFLQALLRQQRYAAPRRLNRFEHQVFSQNGEDGIIREIFRRIGVSNKIFLEIGVADGQETNTTFLLTQGWQGFWLEGDPLAVQAIRRNFRGPLRCSQITLLHLWATAENIVPSLRAMSVPVDIDLLSLDVDRNTYWILEALLPALRPKVAVVEYNSSYPADIDWKVEYDAARSWNGTSYFGASLKALELLCAKHDLCLVGCDLAGVNAFFVGREVCQDRFEEPFTAEMHYEPPRYFLRRNSGHRRCFSDTPER
jgi:hypothetical protein